MANGLNNQLHQTWRQHSPGLQPTPPELVRKRLGLLKETLPKISRVTFSTDPRRCSSPSNGNVQQFRRGPQRALGVVFQLEDGKAPNPDIEGAFRYMVKGRAIGGLVTEGPPLKQFSSQKRFCRSPNGTASRQ